MKVDILAIGAHPDDVEISVAGTLMKHIALGKTVAILDLTAGELGSRGSRDIRAEEAAQAAKMMGVSERVILDMGDGLFVESKENKMLIVEQIRKFQPEVVLTCAIADRHPDHGRASKISSEACFMAGLSKLETQMDGVLQKHWRPKAVYHYVQDYYMKPDFVVDISDIVEKKIEVLKCYASQFHDPNSQEPETMISGEDFFDFLKGRWSEYGRLIKSKYAEGFTTERSLGVTDITQLI